MEVCILRIILETVNVVTQIFDRKKNFPTFSQSYFFYQPF